MATSLAELNPQLSYSLVSMVSSIEGTLANLTIIREKDDVGARVEMYHNLLIGDHGMLREILGGLLSMRRFFRRPVSKRAFLKVAERSDLMKRAFADVKKIKGDHLAVSVPAVEAELKSGSPTVDRASPDTGSMGA